MEQALPDNRQLTFHGQGGKLFGIYIINLILTVITLGLYYPWAKAAVLRYIYQETELEGSRFSFLGTGREMFLGFIKAIGIFILLYGMVLWAMLSGNIAIMSMAYLVFIVALMLLVPIAIHGSLRYRLSRTTWRGIHFGYRGELKALLSEFVVGGFLTVITLGIYSPWFVMKLRRYIFENVRFGNIEFSYHGDGLEYFLLNLKGYLLTLITLGIYSFWYFKDLFAYFVDNMEMQQGTTTIKFRSTATAGDYFSLLVGNVLIVLFTLGLATPWATVRTIHFVLSNIVLEGALDTNAIYQTEGDYKDATGEDISDMMDIGLI